MSARLGEGAHRWLADARAVSQHLGLVLRVHLVKLLITLPAAAGVGRLVHREVGRSLEAERFAAALEPALLIELLRRLEPGLGPVLWALLAAVPLVGLLLLFLDGVLLSALLGRDDDGAGARATLASGGRALGPLLRLAPFGLAALCLFGLLPAYGLHRLGGLLAAELRDERIVVCLRWVLFLLGALVVLHARASHRVARVRAVRGASLGSCLRALGAAWRRPSRTLVRILPWAALSLAVTAGLSILDAQLGRTAWGWALAGVALQQSAGLARTLLGAGALAAEVATEAELKAL